MHLLARAYRHVLPNSQFLQAPGPGHVGPYKGDMGIENRTVGLRIIPGTESKHVRVENRIVGADANPYLGYAANLAAGLEGIEQKIDPPRPL